jgi:hypothetical protein
MTCACGPSDYEKLTCLLQPTPDRRVRVLVCTKRRDCDRASDGGQSKSGESAHLFVSSGMEPFRKEESARLGAGPQLVVVALDSSPSPCRNGALDLHSLEPCRHEL